MKRLVRILCLMSCVFQVSHAALHARPDTVQELQARVRQLCDKASVFLEKGVLFVDSEDVIYPHALDVAHKACIHLHGSTSKAQVLEVLTFFAKNPIANTRILANCMMLLVAFVHDYGYISERLHCLVHNRSPLNTYVLQRFRIVCVDTVVKFPTTEVLLHWMEIVLPELERDVDKTCAVIPPRITTKCCEPCCTLL